MKSPRSLSPQAAHDASDKLRSIPVRYSGAVLAALVAWLLRTALDPYLGNVQPFATFYIAVTLVAWWGGWRPALVTLILGYFASHWFFLPPRHALVLENFVDVVQHLAYFFVTGTIILLMASLARTKAQAAASARLAEQNEQRFRTVAETVPDLIFTTRPDGVADFLNQRFLEYAGPLPAGFECAQLLHPEEAERAEREWQACVRTGRDFEMECRIRAADGSYRWFLRRARPIREEGGSIVKWVGCCTDIEEQKRNAEVLEQRVVERTARLQEMVEDLEQFSYAIVHDLRAPLRAMSNYATLLEYELCAGCLRNPNLEYLRRIQVASKRMDRLVQDALKYSGAVRHRLPLYPVDLARLLPELVHTYPNLLACESSFELSANLPTVLGNETALTQCFASLLDNAVKFVRAGVQPCIKVWAQPREERVRVWVEDEGIGIPPEAAEHIFGLFQRAVTSEYEGTGLGLAISRKLLERMDGKIGVDSRPGKGSSFWVDLRLAQPLDTPAKAA